MCAVMVGDGQNKRGRRGRERGFNAQPFRLSITGVSAAREMVTAVISRITDPFRLPFLFLLQRRPCSD